MSTDPRIEAAAQGIWQSYEENGYSNSPEPTYMERALAKAALAAADAVDPLRKPGHLVEIRDDAWTLQHPPECRPNMLACPLNGELRRLDPSSYAEGIWHVELNADGRLVFRYKAAQ